jgi:hypothetical protein
MDDAAVEAVERIEDRADNCDFANGVDGREE